MQLKSVLYYNAGINLWVLHDANEQLRYSRFKSVLIKIAERDKLKLIER